MNERLLPGDWKVLKFRDCVKQLNTGLNPRDNFTLGKGSIKYITAKNLTGYGIIDFSKCDFIDEQAKQIINKRSDIQVGDILFSSRAPVGQCHLIKNPPDYYDIGESIFSIRPNTDIILPEYFCLYLSSDYFIKAASANVTGSVIQEIRIGNLMDTDVIVPPKQIQEKLAESIGFIDCKLDVNKNISFTLESLAKTIYDYWFVQFDFPDENGKPYKSSGGKMVWNEELKREIPEGWEVKRLPDVSSVQYGYPLKTELFNDHGINVVRIRDILDNSFSAFTNEIVPSSCLTKEGDLLVGMDGNFQMNYWTRNGDIVNQRITRIGKSRVPIMIIKMQIEPVIKAKISSVARSTVGHLGDSDFKQQLILVPSNLDVRIFDQFLRKIITLRKENQSLTSLRDFLLPMLMNGQIKVDTSDDSKRLLEGSDEHESA